MKADDKEKYRSALLDGTLSYESLNKLLAFIEDKMMNGEMVPKELFGKKGIVRILSRHELRVCHGKKSLSGSHSSLQN